MSARRFASRAIIRCESLPVSSAAVLVLAVMATWADARDAEPVCFKEQESIARRAHVSRNTCQRALTELERAGLIKRLGIVGGHATKRGTIKWGLILLWDQDQTFSPTMGHKGEGSPTMGHKQGPTMGHKQGPTMGHNSSQSQSDPKGATDDDDSAAPAATPSAGAAGSPPAALTGSSDQGPDAMTRRVMERRGWSATRAGQWIDGKLTGRRVSDPDAYIDACLDDLDERTAKRAGKTTGSTPAGAPDDSTRAGKATGRQCEICEATDVPVAMVLDDGESVGLWCEPCMTRHSDVGGLQWVDGPPLATGSTPPRAPDVGNRAGKAPVPTKPAARAGRGKRFTDEQKADAVARVRVGESATAVAEDIGASPSTVSTWVNYGGFG